MGQVFGYNGVKEPSFALVHRSARHPSCEVRLYKAYFVAEVPCRDQTVNQAFRQLANYIGVFGTPQNEQNRQIAMTAPVVTGPPKAEKIAMTAPVVSTQEYMQFVLPEEFSRLEEIPVPKDAQIVIKQMPAKVVAVSQFSGANEHEYFMEKLRELKEVILAEELVDPSVLSTETSYSSSSSSSAPLPENMPWFFAKYNPPFTLPPFRRNEVWIELSQDVQSSKLRSLVEEASKTPVPPTAESK